MRIVSIILLLLAYISINAQDFVKIEASKPSVLMGESFQVKYTIYGDSTFLRELYLEDPDTIVSNINVIGQSDDPSMVYNEYADFDVDDYGQWKLIDDKYIDSVSLGIKKQGSRYIAENTLSFTAWYPGKFRIPSLVTVGDSTYHLDNTNAQITVIPPPQLAEQDSLKLDEFSEIRDIIREPVSWRDYLYILIPLGILLLLAILIPLFLYLRKKFKKEEEIKEVVEIIPAHVIALRKLNKLEKEKPWLSGNIKEYQSELTYIIREYLENRFEIDALESSTKEIKSDLGNFDLSPDLLASMANVLQIADLVKFAKANPSGDIHASFLEQAYTFIKETKLTTNDSPNKNIES